MSRARTKQPDQDDLDAAAAAMAAIGADGNGDAPEPEPAPPQEPAPVEQPDPHDAEADAAARAQAEAFGRLSRESGEARQFWIMRHADPDDRTVRHGLYPRPIRGKIDGGVIAAHIGGGLVSVTPDDPYGEKKPRWYGPVPILCEPKKIDLDPAGADGRAALSTQPVPAAGAPPAAPDDEMVQLFSDEFNRYVRVPRRVGEQIEREKAEIAKKKHQRESADDGLAEIRRELERGNESVLEKVLAKLDKIAERPAAPAPPQGQSLAEKMMLESFAVEKERLKLAAAEAGARALEAQAKATAEVEKYRIDREHAPATATAPAAAAQSLDPMKQVEFAMSLATKMHELAGGGAPKESGASAAASITREIFQEITNGVRVLYGTQDDHGPMRRYIELVVDQATLIPRAGPSLTVTQQPAAVADGGAPAAALPAPAPGPTEAEKAAAAAARAAGMQRLALDLQAFLGALVQVCAGGAEPVAAWQMVRGNLSPGFVAEIKKRKTAADLAGILRELAANKALGNYAEDLQNLAALVTGPGKALAEQFLAAAQQG